MSISKKKRGSSRRKGDQYQDLMALRLALEFYIKNINFELLMELYNVGNLDDSIFFYNDKIDACQIKYAINPNDSYELKDFIDKKDPNKKRVYFKKFSDGWKLLREKYPTQELKILLITNHSLSSQLVKIIDENGYFTEKFVKGNVRTHLRETRLALQKTTQLTDKEFETFLSCFQFKTKELDLQNLIKYIKGNLLDHQLGFNDHSIFNYLKEKFEDYAINRHEPITQELFNDLFLILQSRYLLTQNFEVDESLYIKRTDLYENLDKALEKINYGYIIITGLPGSGKSTSLSMYFNNREKITNDEIIRYYCFVDINENTQNIRLQAKSLRINLLMTLQARFSSILKRRFDYSEINFYKILEILGKSSIENNKRIIIFLDGLDHVEKNKTKGHNHILNAIPTDIPNGIIFVVGTQELHNWPYFLKKCLDNKDRHINLSLFDLNKTRDFLIQKYKFKFLTEENIQEIHKKSEGLPIYLKYIADLLKEKGNISDKLKNIPAIVNGDIKSYYEILWNEFNEYGKGDARYLCGVLACLRFPVEISNLFNYQKEISQPVFLDSYQLLQHLLKINHNRVSIFHNSFREFILSKFNEYSLLKIINDITKNLKSLECTDEWFSYIFEYAFKSKDYDYIIEKVNREFVEIALSHFRSIKDIESAFYWAIKAAKEKKDLLALSKLGFLRLKTKQRVENYIDWVLLSKILLSMKKIDYIINYSYCVYQNEWLIDYKVAINIIGELINHNYLELSEQLFKIFFETHTLEEIINRECLIEFAYCLGTFSKFYKAELKFLSQFHYCAVFERNNTYEPEGCPQLEMYIKAIVKFQNPESWKEIKNYKNDISEELIPYYIIRALALYEKKELLKKELEEYIAKFNPESNPELAYYACLAGISSKIVESLLGNISKADFKVSQHIYYNNTILTVDRWKLISIGYINNMAFLEGLTHSLESNETWWNTYLLYLLNLGTCISYFLKQEDFDWFDKAIRCIDILLNLKRTNKDNDFISLLRSCREELSQSLYLITKIIAEQYSDRLKDWFEKIKSLQGSNLWTIQYGLRETYEDYIFELELYENLASIPKCKLFLLELLQICKNKFKNSLSIKGGNRVKHFLKLSLIAAKCGIKNEAIEYLQEGLNASLIYGYHKDPTLYELIDIMGFLNDHFPESSLERCTYILEMVDWMPYLTDGDETRYLPNYIFKKVAKYNISAAMKLLILYSKSKARWQWQDCLESLILEIKSGDEEVLWALSSVFANHFSDNGRHFKQVFDTRQHIVELIQNSGNSQIFKDFKLKLDHYVKLNIPPRYRTNLNSKFEKYEHLNYNKIIDKQTKAENQNNEQKSYTLDGKKVLIGDIESIIKKSFLKYKETIQRLKKQNRDFYKPSSFEKILEEHVLKETNIDILFSIKEYLLNKNKWVNTIILENLGDKLLKMGEIEHALDCFEKAYLDTWDWQKWKKVKKYFIIIARYDKDRAENLVLKLVYHTLKKYSGYQVPSLIADALQILNKTEDLKVLYKDYLQYCNDLFSHLPIENRYDWLKDCPKQNETFNDLAINFLVDELSTKDVELGRRLLGSFCNLGIKRPNLCLPIFFKSLNTSRKLKRTRLLTILFMIANRKPEYLLDFIEQLSKYLNENCFQNQMLVIKTLQLIKAKECLSQKVEERLKDAQNRYNPNKIKPEKNNFISFPSRIFLEFYNRKMIKIYKIQIESCCDLLSLDKNLIIGKIEQILLQKNWSIEKELERLENEWKGYVHPQGFPYVPIMTSLNLEIFIIFNNILDDLLKTKKYSYDIKEGLWRVLQFVDPNYEFSMIKERPDDIKPLVIDEDEWMDDSNINKKNLVSKKIKDEWITLYEQRFLSVDRNYDIPYRMHLETFSSLIKRPFTPLMDDIEKGCYCIQKLKRFSDNELITLDQARDFLSKNIKQIPRDDNNFLPILALHYNSFTFFGYRILATLPEYLRYKYNLIFKDFDLLLKNNRIIKFEEWKEGDVDDSYSREQLSFGTRLSIHKSLLQKIFNDFEVDLCQKTTENRFFFKDRFSKIPSKKLDIIEYKVISDLD